MIDSEQLKQHMVKAVDDISFQIYKIFANIHTEKNIDPLRLYRFYGRHYIFCK